MAYLEAQIKPEKNAANWSENLTSGRQYGNLSLTDNIKRRLTMTRKYEIRIEDDHDGILIEKLMVNVDNDQEAEDLAIERKRVNGHCYASITPQFDHPEGGWII